MYLLQKGLFTLLSAIGLRAVFLRTIFTVVGPFLVKVSTDLKATGKEKDFLKSCVIRKTLKTEYFA